MKKLIQMLVFVSPLISMNALAGGFLNLQSQPEGARIYMNPDAWIGVIDQGHTHIEIALKRTSGNVDLSRFRLVVKAASNEREVLLSNYGMLSDDWTVFRVPLADFIHTAGKLEKGVSSVGIRQVSLTNNSGVLGVDEIRFVGGAQPIVFYGDENPVFADSSHVLETAPLSFSILNRPTSGGYGGESGTPVPPSPSPSASPSPSPTPMEGCDSRAGKFHILKPGTGEQFYDTLVFLPKDYGCNPTKRYPTVISLHGTGGTTLTVDHTAPSSNPEGFIRQLKPGTALAGTYGAIVLAPHCREVGVTDSCWLSARRIIPMIERAKREYAINENRIVATGLSAGGAATNELMQSALGLLAGAMPVSYGPPKTDPAHVRYLNPCALVNFPYWVKGNKDDGTFQPNRWTNSRGDGYMDLVKKCPGYTGKAKITINPTGGHGTWDAFYATPEVRQWLMEQVRE